MSAIPFLPLLWGQASPPGAPGFVQNAVGWLHLFGEPMRTIYGTGWTAALLGGLLTWTKVVSLFCLLGWVVSWLSTAIKERTIARGNWLDVAALASIVGVVGTMLMTVLQATNRIPVYKIAFADFYVVNVLTVLWVLVLFLWLERALWTAVGKAGRRNDYLVLFGLHLALLLGVAAGLAIRASANRLAQTSTVPRLSIAEGLVIGLRMGGTFMGYVVFLRVLLQLLVEVVSIRPRRVYAIAKLCVVESNRRMWAFWVVMTVFLVILAFTHWFLQPPRPAEMGRLFVGTLALLCSLLLTTMVTLLTPLSLPQDIQSQTIYTVVTKPVRRIELIWGRMIGFMTLVTLLTVIFGAISLFYLKRTVGGAIDATNLAAIRAAKQNKMTEANQLREQAEQIRTRMAARAPVYGHLNFLDSRGSPHYKGIDVGQEQGREPRSHIEGASEATAIWHYGLVPDPLSPRGRPQLLDCRIPVERFLRRDTVEDLLNHTYEVKARIDAEERRQAVGLGVSSSKAKEISSTVARAREELRRATDAYAKRKADADAVAARADAAEKAGAADAASLRAEASAMHSPPVPVEMTFTIYRTTKGRVGDPVYAKLEAKNPHTGAEYTDIFPVREYYTNKRNLPASLLAGASSAPPGEDSLRIEIHCITSQQYLGMAQSDLFLLTEQGNFGQNFMKGLFGVWLQALVLTAVGVCAGTFLSWPVALLTTIAFFVAGQIAFAFLLDFTRQEMLGGGPFESLIRLVSHDNQVTDLSPTLAVVTAKTFDRLVMPVMSRLVYVVPNLSSLDVSNTVSDGFAVTWPLMAVNSLVAAAYALPFSVAGYFILKNREVAA